MRIMINLSARVWSVLMIFCVPAGFAEAPKKIVSGTSAQISDFPFQVSLRARGYHFCSGCIIDALHILTTASCVKFGSDGFMASIKVLSGTNDLLNERMKGLIHNVSVITVHEDYDPENLWVNDIAVLTLTTTLPFTLWRHLIPLPDRRFDARLKAELYVAGWGGITSPTDRSTRYLQKIKVRTMKLNVCLKLLYHFLTNGLHLNQNCIQIEDRLMDSAISKGDGGGPMVYYDQVVGILSISDLCIGSPVIYTEVFPYREWIINAVMNY